MSDISGSTFSNYVCLGLSAGFLPSTLISIHFNTISVYPSVVIGSTSHQLSHFFTSPSGFHGNVTHPSNYQHLCSLKLQPNVSQQCPSLTSINHAASDTTYKCYTLALSCLVGISGCQKWQKLP